MELHGTGVTVWWDGTCMDMEGRGPASYGWRSGFCFMTGVELLHYLADEGHALLVDI